MRFPIQTKKKKILAPQLQSSIQNPNAEFKPCLMSRCKFERILIPEKNHFHQTFQKSLFFYQHY